MEWVWEIYKGYICKQFAREGNKDPSEEEKQLAFMKLLGKSTVTVMVQEPWQNTVRFKALARYEWEEMTGLIQDPMTYLLEHFGGGKFKLNFHDGWNFITTQNFRPEGEPKWKALPEIEI